MTTTIYYDPNTHESSENYCLKGFYHSVNTFGTLEGPGTRFLLFSQGCSLRCLYCSNPDTWSKSEGKEVTVGKVIEMFKKTSGYYESNSGGMTVGGGEPCVSYVFVSTVLCEVKRLGFHTAIETSGWGNEERWNVLYKNVDLVLLCIKQSIKERALKITRNKDYFEMLHKCLDYISKTKQPFWCRYVVVPSYTDSKEDIKELVILLNEHIDCLKRVELLPYHTLGKHKWEELGYKYEIEDIFCKKEDLEGIRKYIRTNLSNKNIEVI